MYCVAFVFVTYQCDVSGQVWYLIVSIPDLFIPLYFHNRACFGLNSPFIFYGHSVNAMWQNCLHPILGINYVKSVVSETNGSITFCKNSDVGFTKFLKMMILVRY